MLANMIRTIQARLLVAATDETGMSTVEYAIGTVAAAAFGALAQYRRRREKLLGAADADARPQEN